MVIKFEVPCVPVAQPRQRHSVAFVKGKTFIRNYLPKDDPIWSYKAAIQIAAYNKIKSPLLGPVFINIQFLFPRPKNMIWKNKPMEREYKYSKPDVDNLCKSVFDALNGITYKDDGQICRLYVTKDYVAGNEMPKTIIKIKQLKND